MELTDVDSLEERIMLIAAVQEMFRKRKMRTIARISSGDTGLSENCIHG